MFNKYFEIKSCYLRENKNNGEDEYVIVCNEIRWKWVVASYTRFFTFTEEEFVEKFRNKIKKDARNYWLERLPLEVGCDYTFQVHWITENLPENLK